jgi:hypothetical protein
MNTKSSKFDVSLISLPNLDIPINHLTGLGQTKTQWADYGFVPIGLVVHSSQYAYNAFIRWEEEI